MVDKIRKEHDVQIQIPSAKNGADEGYDIITLTGYEQNCYAAKDEIEKIVKELVSVQIVSWGNIGRKCWFICTWYGCL